MTNNQVYLFSGEVKCIALWDIVFLTVVMFRMQYYSLHLLNTAQYALCNAYYFSN